MMIVTLTKKELAQLCRVNIRTLGLWLNHKYFDELQKLGYNKYQRVLFPKQYEFLTGKLDIDIKDLITKSKDNAV